MDRTYVPQLTQEDTFTLDVMFELATELSPLTTVARELETLATERYPDLKVVWDGKALTSYLQRNEIPLSPLFHLGEWDAGSLIFHYLLDLCLRQEDDRSATGWSRDLSWLARLAYRISPVARRAWNEAVPREVEALLGPAGPVQVSDTDRQSFVEAFIGWMTLMWEAKEEDSTTSTRAEVLPYEEQLYQKFYPVLGNCVYGQRQIETAVEKLIDGAVPFSGSKDEILVVVCSDSRSLPLQNLAQELVERGDSDDALLAFKQKHLRPEELQW